MPPEHIAYSPRRSGMARKSLFSAAQIDLDAAEAQIELLTERQFTVPRLRSIDIPTASIRPNPFQARKTFAGIEDLAQAMRMHGFVSRLLVRQDQSDPRWYQLVYGERRLRAAQLAGLSMVPCDVGEYTDDAMIE